MKFKILMAMIIDERYFGELGILIDVFIDLIEESFILKGVICIEDSFIR